VCERELFNEWIWVQYVYGHWARAYDITRRTARPAYRIRKIHCNFISKSLFDLILIFSFISVHVCTVFKNSFVFHTTKQKKNSVDYAYVLHNARRHISSASRTDEGFINRVTDNRVGRWDFRSFGSLSQPSAEILFRFFCSSHYHNVQWHTVLTL